MTIQPVVDPPTLTPLAVTRQAGQASANFAIANLSSPDFPLRSVLFTNGASANGVTVSNFTTMS